MKPPDSCGLVSNNVDRSSPWNSDTAEKANRSPDVGWGRANNTYWEGLPDETASSDFPPLNRNNSSAVAVGTAYHRTDKLRGADAAVPTSSSSTSLAHTESAGGNGYWESGLTTRRGSSSSWNSRESSNTDSLYNGQSNTSSISNAWTPFNSQILGRTAGSSQSLEYVRNLSAFNVYSCKSEPLMTTPAVSGGDDASHTNSSSSSRTELETQASTDSASSAGQTTHNAWPCTSAASSSKSFAETFNLNPSTTGGDGHATAVVISQSFIPHVIQNKMISSTKQSSSQTAPSDCCMSEPTPDVETSAQQAAHAHGSAAARSAGAASGREEFVSSVKHVRGEAGNESVSSSDNDSSPLRKTVAIDNIAAEAVNKENTTACIDESVVLNTDEEQLEGRFYYSPVLFHILFTWPRRLQLCMCTFMLTTKHKVELIPHCIQLCARVVFLKPR